MADDAESFLGVAPQPVAETASAEQAVSYSPYRGYGGWLAFFCVVQMFISPVIALITLVTTLAAVGEVASSYPSLWLLTILEIVGDVGVVAFGVYTGVVLRSLRPGAVGIARQFMFTALGWSFLKMALPLLGGSDLPSRITEAMLAQTVKGAVQTLISFGIWYTYFHVSKRVKATFPQG